MSSFVRRDTNLGEVETSTFSQRYLIKRPVLKIVPSNSTSISLQNTRQNDQAADPDDEIRPETAGEAEQTMVEKRRFELFIDLIWVGIIGNLADHYSEQAFSSETDYTVGEALGEFIILFLIAIRMWKNLQEYMSKYHTNDFVERAFVIWYLVLAMLYGNNAVYLLDAQQHSSVAIVLYLASKASLTMIETVYSIFLPAQRRGILLRLGMVGGPTVPFFVAACFYGRDLRSILLPVGIILEFGLFAFLETPVFEHFLRAERVQPWDADHWVDRIQDFFIIILGDGVLNLIRSSPLGLSLSKQSGMGVLALCLYYMLSTLYFSGDRSRKFIHAVRRTFWRKTAFMFFHTSMFLSTLVLEVSIGYLIQHANSNAVIPPSGDTDPESEEVKAATELAKFIENGKWSMALALSFTIICLSIIAFLNLSVDAPGSLWVTNRYFRLAPRLVLVALAVCLAIDRSMMPISYLGIMVAALFCVRTWELLASLEKTGGVLEP